MSYRTFVKTIELFLTFVLLEAVVGCATYQPIKSDEILPPIGAQEALHRDYYSSIFFPWPTPNWMDSTDNVPGTLFEQVEFNEDGLITGWNLLISTDNGISTVIELNFNEDGLLTGDWIFTEGPFKGFKVESGDDGAVTGYKIYIKPGSSFRPKDIEAHYEKKLVTEWHGEGKWQRFEDFTTSSYYVWSWKRGRQAFIVVCENNPEIFLFHTYLISK